MPLTKSETRNSKFEITQYITLPERDPLFGVLEF